MSQGSVCRVTVFAVSSVLCLFGLGAAANASGPHHANPACDGRAGRTLLHDGAARVFRFRGQVFACALADGRISRVRDNHLHAPDGVSVSNIRLAGPFVTWKQVTEIANEDDIFRRDLRSGTTAKVASVSIQGSHNFLGDYVVNTRGMVVWVRNHSVCVGGCVDESVVYVNRGDGSHALEGTTNNSQLNTSPQYHDPVLAGSLGLSGSGMTAYWITNGQGRAADLRTGRVTPSPGESCSAHGGPGVLGNEQAVVFVAGGRTYVCSRATGQVRELVDTAAGPPGFTYSVSDPRLAGHFVFWRQHNDLTGNEDLDRFDLSTGAISTGGSLDHHAHHEAIESYVANAQGTIVWVLTYRYGVSGPGFGGTEDEAWVYENDGRTTTTLDHADNSGPNSGPAVTDPIPPDSLGLSASGTTAYWTTNGQARSAPIP